MPSGRVAGCMLCCAVLFQEGMREATVEQEGEVARTHTIVGREWLQFHDMSTTYSGKSGIRCYQSVQFEFCGGA